MLIEENNVLMKSKGYKKFENRMNYFRTDIELVDVLFKNIEAIKGDDKIFKNVKENSHPLLYDRQNSAGSRKIVI